MAEKQKVCSAHLYATKPGRHGGTYAHPLIALEYAGYLSQDLPTPTPPSDLQQFSFEGMDVRTVVREGEPWFVAKDVCDCLLIKNTSDALKKMDEDEKGVVLTDTLGGKQELLSVNESGLYTLIMTSRKPEAQRFRKWVTSEVLPAIRKTGKYETVPVQQVPQSFREALLLAAAQQEQIEQQVKLIELKDARISVMEPSEVVPTLGQPLKAEQLNKLLPIVLYRHNRGDTVILAAVYHLDQQGLAVVGGQAVPLPDVCMWDEQPVSVVLDGSGWAVVRGGETAFDVGRQVCGYDLRFRACGMVGAETGDGDCGVALDRPELEVPRPTRTS